MNTHNSIHIQARLGLVFIGLGISLILMVLVYFFTVLQPRLLQQAQFQASVVAQSLSLPLMYQSVLENSVALQQEVSKILLYNDPTQGEPFVSGLKLEFNPEHFPNNIYPIARGNLDCQACFQVEATLYDQNQSILLGHVTYWINPKNYRSFQDEMLNKLLWFFLFLVALLGLIWLITRRLIRELITTGENLKQTNHYKDKILNTMQDMVFIVDNHGRIIDANLAAENELNRNLAQLKDKLIQDFFKPKDHSVRLVRLIQQNKSSIEVEFAHQSKAIHHGLVSAVLFEKRLNNEDYLVVIKDIHDLKVAEAKLAYQAQMAHSARLKSLGEMASGIAHEINQPLAVIRLGAEGIKYALNRQSPQSFEAEVAQDLIDQVDRASQIINNIRAFARLQPSPKRWTPMHPPVQAALSFFREQLRLNNIQLIEEIDTHCPEIWIETQKFEQIIVNLITNARHALDQSARRTDKFIKVRIDCDEQASYLCVEDNGIGMDTPTLESCMDPFFTTKDAGEGTGLGLSIVHNILNEFKVQYNITSELGKGTCFTIIIPHQSRKTNHE
jgi:PAS domain S-box-containing protein